MTDFLDADELPRERVDELAQWLHDRNIGICEMDEDIVYNDLSSMRYLAEALLQHGPRGIRIEPSTGDLREQIRDQVEFAEAQVAEMAALADRLRAEVERWKSVWQRADYEWAKSRAALSRLVLATTGSWDPEADEVGQGAAAEARVDELTRERDEALAKVERHKESLRIIAGRYREEIDWRLRAEQERDRLRAGPPRLCDGCSINYGAWAGRPAVQEAPAPPELPVEVQRLLRAVDQVRDSWLTADDEARLELWAAVRYETDLVWASLGAGGVPSEASVDAGRAALGGDTP
ncbi:MAG TPA: hypothetical protein VGX25_06800 [Actinophytocola sp.]|uniref:hypothetical protein n=1 Tax=Actinophytocola sp. TaxID=1872138 RepID=UPI002DDD99AE|nr:hypothetical protein [Actinophytocola sp.]HEV2779097.1 hypothetical protein [Actinophytocola sp.]